MERKAGKILAPGREEVLKEKDSREEKLIRREQSRRASAFLGVLTSPRAEKRSARGSLETVTGARAPRGPTGRELDEAAVEGRASIERAVKRLLVLGDVDAARRFSLGDVPF